MSPRKCLLVLGSNEQKLWKWPESMGKLCPTQRVLGTLLTYNCSNVASPSSCGTSRVQQSFRQVRSLQGTQPHAGKGKWSLD